MKTNPERALIIFARSPELGKVKTRLSESLGDDFALTFYKLCAEHIFEECKRLGKNNTAPYLFFTGKDDEDVMNKWVGTSFVYSLQTGKNLGQRMENAFNKVFTNGAKKAIIIGTDVPDIKFTLIENAFNQLDTHDVVIGPSMDGGYYLLGMKKVYNFLFDNISWSTNSVFAETVKKIESNKLKYKVLEKMYDIDTEEDLRKWLSLDNSPKNNSIKDKILNELKDLR